MLGQIKNGSCRSRAILFKVLADAVGLESRLIVVRVVFLFTVYSIRNLPFKAILLHPPPSIQHDDLHFIFYNFSVLSIICTRFVS